MITICLLQLQPLVNKAKMCYLLMIASNIYLSRNSPFQKVPKLLVRVWMIERWWLIIYFVTFVRFDL